MHWNQSIHTVRFETCHRAVGSGSRPTVRASVQADHRAQGSTSEPVSCASTHPGHCTHPGHFPHPGHCAGGPNSRRGSKEVFTARVSFDSRQIPTQTGATPHGGDGGCGGSGSVGGGPVASPHDLWRRTLQQRTRTGNVTPAAGDDGRGNSGEEGGSRSARSSGAPLATDSFSTNARPQSDRRSSDSGADSGLWHPFVGRRR